MTTLVPLKLAQYCSLGDVDYETLQNNPKHLFKYFEYKNRQLARSEGLARKVLEGGVNALFDAITNADSVCSLDLQLRARLLRPIRQDTARELELFSSIIKEGITPKHTHKLFSTLCEVGLFRSVAAEEITEESAESLLERARQSLEFSRRESLQIVDMRQVIQDFSDSVFFGVRSVQVFDSGEAYTAEEALAIAQLFPNLRTLEIPAREFSNSILIQLLNQSNIDSLVLHNAKSFDQALLDSLNRSVTIFYVGTYPSSAPVSCLFATDRCNFSQALILSQNPGDEEDLGAAYHDLYDIGDHHVDILVKYSPDIDEFKIETSDILTDKGLLTLVQKFPNMTALALSDCPKLTDRGLMHASTKLRKLLWLDLSGHSQLTDRALLAFFRNCRQLSSWLLSYCSKITNQSIAQIVSRFVSRLDIVKCSKVTDALADHICARAAQIQELNFDEKQFSPTKVEKLDAAGIKLEISVLE